jgi:hypothetical protein
MDVIGTAGTVMSNIIFEVWACCALAGMVKGRMERTNAQKDFNQKAYEEDKQHEED